MRKSDHLVSRINTCGEAARIAILRSQVHHGSVAGKKCVERRVRQTGLSDQVTVFIQSDHLHEGPSQRAEVPQRAVVPKESMKDLVPEQR